jgi:hypothetical protein
MASTSTKCLLHPNPVLPKHNHNKLAPPAPPAKFPALFSQVLDGLEFWIEVRK